MQGSLAILPQALAADFLRFCQRNPKPCPLIGTSAPGDSRVPELGADPDIRSDLPRYRVWRDGELVAEPELIGISDEMKPDYGDAVPVADDELPVCWACGVTPQSVIATVKPEFCITHYPGSMLVTDRKNTEFAIM